MSDNFLVSRGNRCLVEIRIGWVFAQNRGHRIDFSFPAECANSRQHLVKDCTKTENVSSMIYSFAAELFRSHVSHGANDGAMLRDRRQVPYPTVLVGGLEFGDSEIEYF